jgi:hypothetical protein
LSKESFIEIWDDFSEKKNARLPAEEGLSNAAMAFTPDDTALYFRTRAVLAALAMENRRAVFKNPRAGK